MKNYMESTKRVVEHAAEAVRSGEIKTLNVDGVTYLEVNALADLVNVTVRAVEVASAAGRHEYAFGLSNLATAMAALVAAANGTKVDFDKIDRLMNQE